MTKIFILFTISEHKRVLENTLVLPGFISEHWLCSSSFSTSWAISWLPAKASDNRSVKKVSSAFALFSCPFYTSSLLLKFKSLKSNLQQYKQSFPNHSLKWGRQRSNKRELHVSCMLQVPFVLFACSFLKVSSKLEFGRQHIKK